MDNKNGRGYIPWESVVGAAHELQHAVDRGEETRRKADRLAALVLLFHAQTSTFLLRSVSAS